MLSDYEILHAIDQYRSLSFGDASKAQGPHFDAIEVLAAVPEASEDFGIAWRHVDVKYAYVENLIKRAKDPVEIGRWKRAIFQASVYIFDPRAVSKYIRDSESYSQTKRIFGQEVADSFALEWLADNTAYLSPSVWCHSLDIMSDGLCWGLGSFEDADSHAKLLANQCRHNFVNLRRNVLQSQHMFKHLLERRPLITLFDKDYTYTPPVVDVSELVIAIVPPVVLDAGHGALDIPIHDGSRLAQRKRLRTYSTWRPLPTHIPGTIACLDSAADRRLQIADVASGRARYLYETGRTKELTDSFREVFVNGTRLQQRVDTAFMA